MNRNWKRGLSLALIALCSLVIVADVSAGHRRRRGGCGGGYGYAGGYGGYGYGGYGYGGYGYGGYGYGGYGGGWNYGSGWSGYNYAPGYYGGGYAPAYGGAQIYGGTQTYGGAQLVQPGTAAATDLNAGPINAAGTANANVGDRSARVDTRPLTPNQNAAPANAGTSGNISGNPGAPNAEIGAPNVGLTGNSDAAGTGGADSSLRAAPPVAPGTR